MSTLPPTGAIISRSCEFDRILTRHLELWRPPPRPGNLAYAVDGAGGAPVVFFIALGGTVLWKQYAP